MLNHIMQLAADNANKQLGVLEKSTLNLANTSTTGYKNVRFEQYLLPDGRMEGAERVDTSQGQHKLTQREMDVAIDGFGYIPVTQPDGTTAYTRDGAFALNSDGFMVTHRGDMVGNGIKIPANYQKIFIETNGEVKVMTDLHGEAKTAGQIDLVRFANPEGLHSIGDNKLLATTKSGEAVIDNDSKLKQGSLETANVNMYYEIDRVLRLNATMISNMRIVKFSDDIFRQAVNLRQ